MAAREDQRGVRPMGRKGPDRRVRRDRQGQPLPALAAILRTLDRTGAADRGIAILVTALAGLLTIRILSAGRKKP